MDKRRRTEEQKEETRKRVYEYQKAFWRKRYHERKANHICVRCGVYMGEDYPYVSCMECKEKEKGYYRNRCIRQLKEAYG